MDMGTRFAHCNRSVSFSFRDIYFDRRIYATVFIVYTIARLR